MIRPFITKYSDQRNLVYIKIGIFSFLSVLHLLLFFVSFRYMLLNGKRERKKGVASGD